MWSAIVARYVNKSKDVGRCTAGESRTSELLEF